MLEVLLEGHLANAGFLPQRFRARLTTYGSERVIRDCTAGMNDRSALDEYTRLFDPDAGP